ncbi:hypothetical protein [Planctomycetes bacterium TBK1r]|uniref:DUF1573 domain-containing protein n=1 Tax=Stieleria magnilauensis TaxID=2527963 RepID=A0ABX5XJI8_9BACT|nr:hypothetical protein TBK1r_00450 [Planctomycetes bacterium TBK1r]
MFKVNSELISFCVLGLAIFAGCFNGPIPNAGHGSGSSKPVVDVPTIELPTNTPVFESSDERAELELPIKDMGSIDVAALSVMTSCNCVDAKIIESQATDSPAAVNLRLDRLNVGIHHASIVLSNVNGRRYDSVVLRYEVANEAKLAFSKRDFGIVTEGANLIFECKIIRAANDQRDLYVVAGDIVPSNPEIASPQPTRAAYLGDDTFAVITDVSGTPGLSYRNVWVEDQFGRQLTKMTGITWEIESRVSVTPSALMLSEENREFVAILEVQDVVDEIHVAKECGLYLDTWSLDQISPEIYRLSGCVTASGNTPRVVKSLKLILDGSEVRLPIEWSFTENES